MGSRQQLPQWSFLLRPSPHPTLPELVPVPVRRGPGCFKRSCVLARFFLSMQTCLVTLHDDRDLSAVGVTLCVITVHSGRDLVRQHRCMVSPDSFGPSLSVASVSCTI